MDPSMSVKRNVTVPVGRPVMRPPDRQSWGREQSEATFGGDVPPSLAGRAEPDQQSSAGRCPAFLTILTLHAIITPKGEEATAMRRGRQRWETIGHRIACRDCAGGDIVVIIGGEYALLNA